jgi:hypothetical protein
MMDENVSNMFEPCEIFFFLEKPSLAQDEPKWGRKLQRET